MTLARNNSCPASIAWLVPSPIKGSGGIREIFNKIQYLCDRGHECHVFVEGTMDVYQLMDQVEAFYGTNDCCLHSGWDWEPSQYDLLFATIWHSAAVVSRAESNAPKAYLIQDYEPWFNPLSDAHATGVASYGLGLDPVCLGRWLPNKLYRDFGIRSRYFDFCCDQDTYHLVIPYAERELAICYIYQPEKPRRCSELGIEALAILKRQMPEVNVYLFGSTEAGRVPFPHQHLGILTPNEINALYNRCALGLCISSSNPSRIPFEMMSAGLPVVDLRRENNLYDLPEAGVTLADDTPAGLGATLVRSLSDRARLARMSSAGQACMKGRTMECEYGQFYAAVTAILRRETFASWVPPVPMHAPACNVNTAA